MSQMMIERHQNILDLIVCSIIEILVHRNKIYIGKKKQGKIMVALSERQNKIFVIKVKHH